MANFTGTPGDDNLIGTIGNDNFFASLGNDTYNGDAGTDTLNYNGLGQAVTLLPRGAIVKAGGGTDSIQSIERIVGEAGQANAIDASIYQCQPSFWSISRQ
jgi:Ca2+-binding RTX toxin-like protein